MNLVKTLEDMVKVRMEIQKISEQLDNNQRVLDGLVYEMIEFLKHKGIIETKSV